MREGDYRELLVTPEQLAFMRTGGGQTVVCAWNASDKPVEIMLKQVGQGSYGDALNPGESFSAPDGHLKITLYPRWGRVLVR